GHVSDPGNGTIPESQVVGRAFMIVWPPSRWRGLPIPGTFGEPGGTRGKTPADAALGPVMVQSAAPLLPLELGFAGAVPLTWLQRRFRLRGRRPAGGRVGRARRGRPDGGRSEGGRSDRGRCEGGRCE